MVMLLRTSQNKNKNGDALEDPQLIELDQGPDIVVATPN
jgi:hypothetical protein